MSFRIGNIYWQLDLSNIRALGLQMVEKVNSEKHANGQFCRTICGVLVSQATQIYKQHLSTVNEVLYRMFLGWQSTKEICLRPPITQ